MNHVSSRPETSLLSTYLHLVSALDERLSTRAVAHGVA